MRIGSMDERTARSEKLFVFLIDTVRSRNPHRKEGQEGFERERYA
jgi:hypothetical protein